MSTSERSSRGPREDGKRKRETLAASSSIATLRQAIGPWPESCLRSWQHFVAWTAAGHPKGLSEAEEPRSGLTRRRPRDTQPRLAPIGGRGPSNNVITAPSILVNTLRGRRRSVSRPCASLARGLGTAPSRTIPRKHRGRNRAHRATRELAGLSSIATSYSRPDEFTISVGRVLSRTQSLWNGVQS